MNLKLTAEIEREANEIAELKKKNDQKDRFGKGKKGKKEKTKVKKSPVKSKEIVLEVETETRCEKMAYFQPKNYPIYDVHYIIIMNNLTKN